MKYLFSRGHAILHLAVFLSVRRSVGPSVRTAPAQPSATVLPCIRPCFLDVCLYVEKPFEQGCHYSYFAVSTGLIG